MRGGMPGPLLACRAAQLLPPDGPAAKPSSDLAPACRSMAPPTGMTSTGATPPAASTSGRRHKRSLQWPSWGIASTAW